MGRWFLFVEFIILIIGQILLFDTCSSAQFGIIFLLIKVVILKKSEYNIIEEISNYLSNQTATEMDCN
jgi:hypothetical protein